MRVSRWAAGLFIGMSVLASGRFAGAQTATQTVTFRVVSWSQAAMGTALMPMVAMPAAENRSVSTASVSASSYAVSTNEPNQKISASLNEPMPKGGFVAVSLTPPRGASSAGTTLLHGTAADVVTGISASQSEALPLVYTVDAGFRAMKGAPNRLVTFTITSGL